MKCLTILLFALLFYATALHAQYSDNLMFGVKAGASRSLISNLPSILVSENFYTGYKFTKEQVVAPTGGLFVNYRINESRIGLEAQLNYFQYATNINYSDINDFTYTCRFQYHFLGIGTFLKSYFKDGLNAGMGMRFGFNLSPENITYTSNAHQINWGGNNQPLSDDETQTELRDVIKGLNTTELVFVLCYEFKSGLSVDLSYNTGLNDMVETLVNRHNFIDSKNSTSSLQFTVGWAISVDQSKKDKRGRR